MGELTCTAKMAKVLLFVFTLVVALAGIVLFSFGIWFVSDPSSVRLLDVTADDAYHGLIRAAGGILIGVGVLLAIVGVAGCWGSCAQKTGCLTCYQAIIILLVILQIVATVLAGVFHSEITRGLTNSMNDSLTINYGKAGKEYITESWNFMQFEFSCCGVRNYSDWSASWWQSNQTVTGNGSSVDVVPGTCCQLTNNDFLNPIPRNRAQCNAEAKQSYSGENSELHLKGCEFYFEEWFSSNWGILIGIVVAIIVVEISGIVLSCCIASSIKKGYEYV